MNFSEHALAVIESEAQAIFNLKKCITDDFEKACTLLFNHAGRVIVTGMGKSGHIGRKIASTFASLGTPAFFVHPAEAIHGDLGMVTPQDVVLMLSYSGQTPEMLSLIPSFKRLGVSIIAITGHPESALAKQADVHLNIAIGKEACPMNLAPTTSTTATLVLGDALAIALLEAKGFNRDDFARSHPGGQLGKKLLLKIDDIWHTQDALPLVHVSKSISEALIVVTDKKLGMACIINDAGQLMGIYTDGDVRRTLNQQLDIHSTPIAKVMTKNCKTIAPGTLAANALNLMQHYKITSLVVTNQDNIPQAIVHLHDILHAGVV